jgi:hypothetical protein
MLLVDREGDLQKHIQIMIQMWKSATRTCDKNGLSFSRNKKSILDKD